MGYVDIVYNIATTNMRRIDGLVQERRNSSALALSYTYPLICKWATYGIVVVNIVEDFGHFIAGLQSNTNIWHFACSVWTFDQGPFY